MTATFGQVIDGASLSRANYWIIDAMPHVMSRVRKMFSAGQQLGKGKHTHATVALPKTQDCAKDIVWLMERYPMLADNAVLLDLKRLANRYDRACEIAAQDGATVMALTEGAWELSKPPYPEQAQFFNKLRAVRRMMLADAIGEGKTVSAFTMLCEPDARPALISCQAHLCLQWQRKLEEFLPMATSHLIRGTIPYQLPSVDVLITAHNRLAKWQDVLVPLAPKFVALDEGQEFRHVDTKKRAAARALCESAEYATTLTATPSYNYGAEVWSVIDVIAPGALGDRADFCREWCDGGDRVKDPVALHAYLTSRGLMMRRNPASGRTVEREIVTLEGDLESLKQVQDVARQLAISVLSNRVGESERAGSELDWKLRQATGVAKARPVAELVKMLAAEGEQVILAGWHRDVYRVWLKELKDLNPAMFTGTESTNQKNQAQQAFIDGRSRVLILSLRSGAGIDGLQHVCSTVVIGELDWSPHVMNQVIGRVDRKPQAKPVRVYFPVIEDGSDPFIMGVNGEKLLQHEGIMDGKQSEAAVIADSVAGDRVRKMAEQYLASIGESAPVVAPTKGLHSEVHAALLKLRLTFASERDMQDAIWAVLPDMVNATAQREARVTSRTRLDFLFERRAERVAIECKIERTGRANVYRQVRQYVEECGITGLIVVAPWPGIGSFVIDGVPVTVVDWSRGKL